MNVALSYVSEPDAPFLKELDRVRLLVDAPTDDRTIVPAASTGTVVGVWDGGQSFEVEFTRPFQALVTVAVEHLRKLPDDAT